MAPANIDIPTINTPNLDLRAWQPEDAEALFDILQETDILRYFPDPHAPSREKVEAYIQHHRIQWQTRGYGHWAITTREDGLVVGWCGLEYLTELEETEVAYLLSQRVWGRGYASEAARAAVRFGFDEARLQGIIGLVHPDNVASISVLEKCGLTYAHRLNLWGMLLSRYRISREAYASGPAA
jgi:RimJ/RimL family protein N-acetyltransferase